MGMTYKFGEVYHTHTLECFEMENRVCLKRNMCVLGTIENVISCNRYKEKTFSFCVQKGGNACLLQHFSAIVCHFYDYF